MSGFEFVIVLYAIITGMAISNLLSDWADQLRARHRFELFPLQLAFTSALLVFNMSFLWAVWTFRELDWTFFLYCLFALIPIILALSSRLLTMEVSENAPPFKEQYFRNSRPAFLILAMLPVLLIFISWFSELAYVIPDRPDIVITTIFRIGLIIGILVLAWSRNERVHWIGVTILFVTILSLSARITERIIQGAA